MLDVAAAPGPFSLSGLIGPEDDGPAPPRTPIIDEGILADDGLSGEFNGVFAGVPFTNENIPESPIWPIPIPLAKSYSIDPPPCAPPFRFH